MNKWMDGWVDEHVIYPGGGAGGFGYGLGFSVATSHLAVCIV